MKEIGPRVAKEIRNRQDADHNLDDVLDEIDITRQSLHHYKKRKSIPSGAVLRKMALAGYDVHYLLTGERKDERKIYKGGHANEQSRRTV